MSNTQQYPVHSNTDNFHEAWTEAYCTPQGDPHSKFAELIATDRQKAKGIAYSFMFSEKARELAVIQMLHQARQESAFVYKRLSKMINKPVPTFVEILKEMD